jgi:hypothetical protein
MTKLRELTDAELDIVGGGTLMRNPNPQPIGIKLVEEILVDILKILEGNQGKQPVRAM